MRKPVLALAALAVALAAAACARETPRADRSPSPSPSPSPGPLAARMIVFEDGGDLWLYTVEGDSMRRLTSDGRERVETLPRFVDPSTVSFAQQGGRRLLALDLDTGEEREVLDTGTRLQAYDWSPDRRAIAFLGDADPEDDTVGLWIHRLDGASGPERVRSFPAGLGRGFRPEDDEVRVAWSPDGGTILVVDTTEVPNQAPGPATTMYVVRPDGSDVVEPRDGTFARWSLDSRTIYYRGFDTGFGWRALDVSDGSERALAITERTLRPALSPDGSRLAYDDGAARTRVLLYDLEAGAESEVATGFAGPIWLAGGALAATRTRPCEGEETCGAHSPTWESEGAAERVPLGGGQRSALSLPTTLDADVLYVPAGTEET